MTMREILFRGKHICGNGDWIYGYYFQKPDPCTKDGKPIAHCISDLPPFGSKIVISTLGQYTGLTDKNGTKIFEGDICRNTKTNEIVSVKWHGTMAGYVWSKRRADNGNLYDFGELFRAFDKYEVIGNIHDNPELMEDK